MQIKPTLGTVLFKGDDFDTLLLSLHRLVEAHPETRAEVDLIIARLRTVALRSA